MEANTASLRSSAPQWTLAGDQQLLDILQNIHQSLVTRCQEVNTKLDEMVLALDGASVDLQNVNNKFMALSNTQFIESRVYDDDVDVAPQEQPKESTTPPHQLPDIDKLKQSIRVLENSHSLIEILNSDSDSDDDEVSRVVLKPKDMYAHRPLPYIIGSQAWRNKWHAGLHPDDSDTDSSASKPEEEAQYSDSEPEADVPLAHSQAHMHHEREESTTSSELPSEQDIPVLPTPSAGAKPSPADIAAELARRLGGHPAKVPAVEPEYETPSTMNKKVYRPDQPSAGTVFCDEPPPLDQYQSEGESQEDDDIFAELHKSKPYSHDNKAQSRLAEDLFSGLGEEGGDIFSDFRDDKPTSNASAQKSTLFEDESEPELFATKASQPQETSLKSETVKKPIGGISLFGNNKGAASIGAAILKRNQPKSPSSSDEDGGSDVTPQAKQEPKTKEKDIFDDLFAKSEREQKNKGKSKDSKVEAKKDNTEVKKVDLFSDNIFDDIDDIFTSNIKTVSKNDKKSDKPLFDDDDDIFSDIAVSKNDSKSSSSKKKSIFDSDDDLFTDNVMKTERPKTENVSKTNTNNQFENVDDIFSDLVETEVAEDRSNIVNVVAEEITNNKDLDKNTVKNETQGNNNKVVNKTVTVSNDNSLLNDDKVPNNNFEKSSNPLFGDEDDDELFAKETKKSSPSDVNSNIVNSSLNIKSDEDNMTKSIQSSSLFDDDSDENDLFGSISKKSKPDIGNNNFKQSTEIRNENTIPNRDKTLSMQKSSLFDDDDEESNDIFGTSSKNATMKDNDAIKTELIKESIPEENIESSSLAKKSLFDDNDAEDTDLFAKINKKPSVVAQKPTQERKLKLEQQKPPKNVSKPKPYEKPIIKNQSQEEKPVNTVQKPHANEQKPILKEKPSIQEPNSPLIKEESIVNDRNPELFKQIDENLTAKVEIESKIVDSNIPKSDNKNTVPVQEELFIPKPDLNTNAVESKIPDLPETKTEKDNTLDEVKDALFSEPKDTLFHTPAVFDNIFSEPPAFEKSSEPKKSKNVNALFDDDSDDEALFFKKDDPTLDEKPELTTESTPDALFGIFHDEPPAIDVDFTQKNTKSNLKDDFLNDSDDDLFTIKSKKEPAAVPNVEKDSATTKNATIPDAEKIETKPTPVSNKAEIFEQKIKTETKPKDTTDSETKKVGKLKTMNFNIDVSTLLPGASPKKKTVEQTDGQATSRSNDNLSIDKEPVVKPIQKDPSILTAKSHEDLQTKEKPEILKSVSFDGKPDSNILDNKISKERAKIQVKRRPSTRRARQEAVRKSTIDQADDSTDNSSSFDDPPRLPKSVSRKETKQTDKGKPESENHTEVVSTKTELPKPPEIQDSSSVDNEILSNTQKDVDSEIVPKIQNLNLDKTRSDIEATSQSSFDTIDSKTIRKDNNAKDTDSDTSKPNDNHPDTNISKTNLAASIPQNSVEQETRPTETKNVTSKIVYILNDEDIFTNPSIEKPEIRKSKVLNIIDDDDDEDLFKNVPKIKKDEASSNISTLGNAYKDIATHIEREVKSTIENRSEIDRIDNQNKSKVEGNTSQSIISNKTKSLFDDLSDEESKLFNPNKNKSSKVKSILDSDSEDDLFGGGRKRETKDTAAMNVKEKDVKPKVEVKSSLFGDEDDDDDLFGVKVKSKVVASTQPTRSTREVVSIPPEPVFDDPLSMLGGDDE